MLPVSEYIGNTEIKGDKSTTQRNRVEIKFLLNSRMNRNVILMQKSASICHKIKSNILKH